MADLVDVPAVFDASGGGGRLLDGGALLEGAGGAWATLGHSVHSGVVVWRFRIVDDSSGNMRFGLISGAEPVPAGWRSQHARGYEIWNGSVGWVDVVGTTRYGAPPNWHEAPRGSEVECTLDMGARTMAFTVNDSMPPCVAFSDIVAPVRPIVWNGSARLLRVRVAGTGALLAWAAVASFSRL